MFLKCGGFQKNQGFRAISGSAIKRILLHEKSVNSIAVSCIVVLLSFPVNSGSFRVDGTMVARLGKIVPTKP